MTSSNHGGVRQGAGRKKASPTKQIRVDSDLADIFKDISDDYRLNPEKAKRIRDILLEVG
ncbi:hypothetical protein [Photobacterium sanguinicancri]|uniref:Uncharacterized protein n=1 Tax=Photobacterium sanguinicancri TaxID=875932 RepID=A0AAW7Y922_9GAMM|nr:hypothetical protein [Photobacterium sanguinicancri]MDO6543482.1 hypothetical protein [Photobacterium sanguinicancri]